MKSILEAASLGTEIETLGSNIHEAGYAAREFVDRFRLAGEQFQEVMVAWQKDKVRLELGSQRAYFTGGDAGPYPKLSDYNLPHSWSAESALRFAGASDLNSMPHLNMAFDRIVRSLSYGGISTQEQLMIDTLEEYLAEIEKNTGLTARNTSQRDRSLFFMPTVDNNPLFRGGWG